MVFCFSEDLNIGVSFLALLLHDLGDDAGPHLVLLPPIQQLRGRGSYDDVDLGV